MGLILLCVIVGSIFGGAALGVTVLSGLGNVGSRNSKELRSVRYQLKSARKALYTIASGTAGNPTLEAQIALEDIDRKELEA